MRKALALYELQTLDLQIEDLIRKLRSVEAQLADDARLRVARARQAELEQTLHHAQGDLTERELTVGQTEAHIKAVEQKLYGGTVRNPKELQSLEQDLRMLQRQRSGEEDAALEALLRAEELQRSLAEAKTSAATLAAQTQQLRARLSQEREQLVNQLHAAEAKRAERASRQDPATLQTYERLRREKRGVAVAQVEQLHCLACRIAQPASLVQQARSNPELTFCKSCGRILLPGR